MFKTLYQLFQLLDPKHRRQFFLLLPAIIFMGIMDVTGIAFVVPFMMVVADPETIQTSHTISVIYHFIGFNNPETFLLFLGWLVFFALLFGNVFAVFGNWLLLRFSGNCEKYFGNTLYEYYLRQPYLFFVKHNVAHLTNHVIDDVSRVISSALSPGLFTISKMVGIIFILILLLYAQPQLAVALCIVMVVSFFVVSKISKNRLHLIGIRNGHNRAYRVKVVIESFSGIKEIKLLHKENIFLHWVASVSNLISRDAATVGAFSSFPRYFLETIAFGGMILVVLYLLSHHLSASHVVPILALYAFSGYRIMPALQVIFAAHATISGASSSVNLLIKNMGDFQNKSQTKKTQTKCTSIVMNHHVGLEAITFTYPNRKKPIFENLNLIIPANKTVAFVGSTGAGKTTIVDLVLGLLQPKKGFLKVDDQIITEENMLAWQAELGYVPQNIFLLDGTISENIALGVPLELIDQQAVAAVSKIANLHDFVMTFPDAYSSIVGDRGIQLSGGQRQRIGIARALYHDPKILILDEATSALDGITETIVMDAIHHLNRKKTIIIVAHRLSTVRECDIVFLLENGVIEDAGTYDDLVSRSEKFRQFAKLERK